MGSVAERYRAVAERVARAAERSGRAPTAVTLLAASKTFAPEIVAEAARAGCRDVGENYVQEARAKRDAVDALLAPDLRPRWHLIGRLQRNKARRAAELFDVVHSLHSLVVAEALDRAAVAADRDVDAFVEVSLAPEAAKGGVAPDALGDLLASFGALRRVRVRGLMAIPPQTDRAEDARPHFRRLRELRDRLADLPRANGMLKDLSMGMSADFEVAIEEGASIVRVGRAIFGERG